MSLWTKKELIIELIKAKVAEARLKKGYEVKGDGRTKEYILLGQLEYQVILELSEYFR